MGDSCASSDRPSQHRHCERGHSMPAGRQFVTGRRRRCRWRGRLRARRRRRGGRRRRSRHRAREEPGTGRLDLVVGRLDHCDRDAAPAPRRHQRLGRRALRGHGAQCRPVRRARQPDAPPDPRRQHRRDDRLASSRSASCLSGRCPSHRIDSRACTRWSPTHPRSRTTSSTTADRSASRSTSVLAASA